MLFAFESSKMAAALKEAYELVRGKGDHYELTPQEFSRVSHLLNNPPLMLARQIGIYLPRTFGRVYVPGTNFNYKFAYEVIVEWGIKLAQEPTKADREMFSVTYTKCRLPRHINVAVASYKLNMLEYSLIGFIAKEVAERGT